MAEDNSGEWWDDYSKYLKSAQWKELSAKVLERDKRVCQNCFRHNATQAHHVSYKNYNKLGYSLAFDCVAICDECHKLAHPHLRDGFDAAKEPVVSDLEEMANNAIDKFFGVVAKVRRLPPPSLIWFDFDEKEDKRKS